jgi:hypothetical protein
VVLQPSRERRRRGCRGTRCTYMIVMMIVTRMGMGRKMTMMIRRTKIG